MIPDTDNFNRRERYPSPSVSDREGRNNIERKKKKEKDDFFLFLIPYSLFCISFLYCFLIFKFPFFFFSPMFHSFLRGFRIFANVAEYTILCLLHSVLVMSDTVQHEDITPSTDPLPSLSLSSTPRRVLLPIPIITPTAPTPRAAPPLRMIRVAPYLHLQAFLYKMLQGIRRKWEYIQTV